MGTVVTIDVYTTGGTAGTGLSRQLTNRGPYCTARTQSSAHSSRTARSPAAAR